MRDGSVQLWYTKKALLSKSLSWLSRTMPSLSKGCEPWERGREGSRGPLAAWRDGAEYPCTAQNNPDYQTGSVPLNFPLRLRLCSDVPLNAWGIYHYIINNYEYKYIFHINYCRYLYYYLNLTLLFFIDFYIIFISRFFFFNFRSPFFSFKKSMSPGTRLSSLHTPKDCHFSVLPDMSWYV